jgi:hypothetical protein
MASDPLAGASDVEARWRALSAGERVRTATLIEDASAILRSKVSRLDGRIADATLDPILVRSAVVSAVIRALRNPEGYRQEVNGDNSVTYAGDGTPGEITFTPDEVMRLAPAGTIRFGSARLHSTLETTGFETALDQTPSPWPTEWPIV